MEKKKKSGPGSGWKGDPANRHAGFKGNSELAKKCGEIGGPAKHNIQTIINRMKKAGYKELDKESLMRVYRLLFNTPVREVKKITNDPDIPWGLKILVDNLQDKKTRAKAWAEYQSWVFGKAPSEVNITHRAVTELDDKQHDDILKIVGDEY